MRICLQAGHKGVTSGATGAPGERDWTTKIVPMIAERLRAKGVEVYEADAFANNDDKVTGTDWDLFLAVHYDADVYNDTGGFVDFPEPSTDHATVESQRIAAVIKDYYFPTTGIKYVSRSNANTRYYYMWKALSQKTPCVIIECGVGWRKPEDYETLRKYDLIADTLSAAILKSVGIVSFLEEDIPTNVEEIYGFKELEDYDKYCTYDFILRDYVKVKKELKYQIIEKEKYKTEARALRTQIDEIAEDIATINKEIEELDKILADHRAKLIEFETENTALKEDKATLIEEKGELDSQIESLTEERDLLQKKLTSQNPLEAFTARELWAALFEKVFRR